MFARRECYALRAVFASVLACAVIGLSCSNAQAQPPRNRNANGQAAPSARRSATIAPRSVTPVPMVASIMPAPSVPNDGRTAAMMLDALEIEIITIESGGADPVRLCQVEAEAREAERRAQTTNEQFRARRLLRRAERAQRGQTPLETVTRAAGGASGLPPDSRLAKLAQFVSQNPTTPDPGTPVLEPPINIPSTSFPGSPVFVPGAMPIVAPVAPPLTRHYVNLDALGWWVKSDQLPALVTTSPIGTPQTTAGVLGLPTTTVLFGDQGVNGGMRLGGRVQGGIWVDPYQTFALEGHYFGLVSTTTTFSRSSTFSAGSLDDVILARPFFNNAPGIDQQRADLIAFPDFVVLPLVFDIDGSIQVQEYSRIQSAGGGGRYSIGPHNGRVHLFVLGGYRFFQLSEGLTISTTESPGTDPFPFPIPQGAIQQFDQFNTQNTFNGGDVGLAAEMGMSRVSLTAETRLALGNMHQTLDIDGRTSAVSGPYIASYPGGLLAQPSNIGNYSRNQFAWIPSVDVKLGFQLLPVVRLTIGYNLTFVTNVLRPGDQIDTNVNTTQIAGLPLVGPANPAATLNESTIWLQGWTAGLDMRF